MSKEPVEDPALSWKAKGMLAYLMSKPNDWQIWVKDLVKRSTDGRDSVLSGLKELRGRGYAKKEQPRRKDGTLGPVEYMVFESPQEEINTDDIFEGHPNSIRNKPEAPVTRTYAPGVADPHQESPEVEELARQLAPPIDLVWGYDKATDKSLLHAAKELFRQCKQGSTDDILDALDTYLEKNGDWARKNIDSPMGLVTLVARKYQKMQFIARGRATARDDWADAAEHSQAALAERLAMATETKDEDALWWQVVLKDLQGQMTRPSFNMWLKNTCLLERQDDHILVGVANNSAKDWLENRLLDTIKRAVAADGVTKVTFEVTTTN